MAGKITKRESSAWGDTIHRKTKTGNHTETFNNFWGDQETTWTSRNANGDLVKHTQVRNNGRLLSNSSEVLEKSKSRTNGAFGGYSADSGFGLESVVDLLFELGFYAIIIALIVGVVLGAVSIICICVGIFFVFRCSLAYVPLFHNYVFTNIFYHNLFRTTILSKKLKKNLMKMEKALDPEAEVTVDIQYIRDLFDKCDRIASKLEKCIIKKNAVGLEELMMYHYKKTLFMIDAERFLTNSFDVANVSFSENYFSVKELKDIIGTNMQKLYLEVSDENRKLYEEYVKKNQWYLERNKKCNEFIDQVVEDKDSIVVNTNLNIHYWWKLIFPITTSISIIDYCCGTGKYVFLCLLPMIIYPFMYLHLHNKVFPEKEYNKLYVFIGSILYCKNYKIKKFTLPIKLFKGEVLRYTRTGDMYYIQSEYCSTIIENTGYSTVLYSSMPNMLFIKIYDNFKAPRKKMSEEEWFAIYY